MRRIQDSEHVAMPEQHAGNPSGRIALLLDLDIAASGDHERIDRQRRDSLVTQEGFGPLLRHLETERMTRGFGHFFFTSAFFANISRNSLAISRSLSVSLPMSRYRG